MRVRQLTNYVLLLYLALAGRGAGSQVLQKHVPATVAGLTPVGLLSDTTRLNLAISLPLRNEAALARLLKDLYNPANPNYRHYLSPTEFARQFGPTQKDYERLTLYAQAHHFEVRRTHSNRTLLDVSGTVADIRRAFAVNLKVYPHPTENRTFFAPDANPTIDAGVPVLAIKGLDNFFLPRPCGRAMPLGGTGYHGSFQGTNFRNAYVPGVSLAGSGQQVALVEFDGYYTNDIINYMQTNGIPAVTLTNVSINGYQAPPVLDPSGDGEVSLDIEMVNSMAPGLSQILVYEEQLFDPADDMLNQIATDDLAHQISSSWFYDIDAVSDQIFKQYAAQGQSFFSASGDSGAFPPGDISEPMDSAYITTVGGTALSTSASGAWLSETVWDDLKNNLASGGGYTTNYQIPPWQSEVSMISNGGSQTFRNTPDVACVATGVMVIYNNGTKAVFEGTSCAAPLWAAYTALVNQQAAVYGDGPVGFLNPALYSIGTESGYDTNFNDITTGNNTNSVSPSKYFAVPGYDLCTGWGTPNGSNLINTLAPPDTLVMRPVPGFASSGPGGGPFSATTQSFLLTNESLSSLAWSMDSDAPWLSVSPTNGILGAGATVSVLASMTAVASNLLIGDYLAHLWLTNLSDGRFHHANFMLQISNQLELSPEGGFEFAGPPSGPFNFAAENCMLTNASQNAVAWSLATNPPWLDVSPSSGVLAPYGSTQITCTPNADAEDLPTGDYSGTLVISNDTFGAEDSLPLLFLVGQLVQNGGFETGDLIDWTLLGDLSSTFVYSNSIAVYSGTYGVDMGQVGEMAYMTQEIPTVPGASYSISLWLDSPDGLTTNAFSVAWGGETLCDFTNLPAIGWTNLQFTVLATNTSTLLTIGGRDDQTELGLDDVSVTASPPTITSVVPASGPAAGGTTVLVSGVGFQSHAMVAFGSLAAASVTFDNTSNLTVVTPASSTAGPVNVTITNADGQIAVLTNGFIFQGAPMITWTNPQVITYGTALGAVQLDAFANVQGNFVYVPPAGTILDAGSNVLAAVFTPDNSMDYSSVTDYVKLEVLPAALSVTASNVSRPYGVTNPVFTGVIAGLQNGDNITASYSCTATPSSPAGFYPIMPSLMDPNLRLTNYLVSISNGMLTVLAPVPPTFQEVSLLPGLISFDWKATAGVAYQVQYNSNLADTNWTNLGGLIIATNAMPGVTDPITNSHRFYRVLLVPQ